MVDVSGTATTKKVSLANIVNLANVGNLRAANNLADLADASSARGNLGLGTAATSASTDFSPAFYNIVTKTGSYTLTNAENGKVIFCNSSGRIDITVPSGLTSGFSCRVVQGGVGRVRFVASSTTINGYTSGSDAPNAVIGLHGVADLVPTGTNIYSLHGDITFLYVYQNANSISLDGTDDNIVLATSSDFDTTSAFTISAWVNPTALTNYEHVWSRFSSSHTQFYITPSGNLTLTVDRVSFPASTGTVSTGSWQHIAVSWQSGTGATAFYINGSAAGTGTNTTTLSSGTTKVTIGTKATPSGSNFFNGLMDEVALFNSVLSASQISNIYKGETNGGSGGTNGVPGDLATFSPLGWWRMGDDDGATGTTITDQGSGGNNGTLTNGPTFSTDVP